MVTKGYGLSINDIDQSCPADLEPYAIAHQKELEEQDYMQYVWWGNYGICAVSIAIERCFAGKKAKSKFLEKPILSQFLENAGLTQEQIYEKEIKKALLAEEQWIASGKRKGLPETII